MGNDGNDYAIFRMDRETGTFSRVEMAELAEFTTGGLTGDILPETEVHCQDWQSSGKLEIPMGKMSRKKYMKRLMGRGLSRNTANEWADWARLRGVSYSQAFWLDCWSGMI